MNRKEFFEWLETCPTHKFNITFDEYEFVTVCFPNNEEEEEEAMAEEMGMYCTPYDPEEDC